MKKTKKVVIILIIILIITLLTIYGIINNKLEKMNFINLLKGDIAINQKLKDNPTGYRNIAIFGLDAKNDTYQNSRTDCIIVASLNEATNDVKLVSVYRDTYLKIPNHNFNRVNAAYAYEGAKLAIDTLNINLDLDIAEFVVFDFATTVNAIDAIGGVEIDVTNAETTQITGIPTGGTYNLTGKQALQYGRIRKIDNDYARTERMRTVATAAFHKIKSLNVLELNNLLDTILPQIETNITKSEILELLPKITSYKIADSIGWPYETKGFTLKSGAWIGPPVNLEKNVIELHKQLFNEENYEVSEEVKTISQEIIDITGYK